MQVLSLYRFDLLFQYGRIKNLPEHRRLAQTEKISTAMDTIIIIICFCHISFKILSKHKRISFFLNLVCQPCLGFQAIITMRHQSEVDVRISSHPSSNSSSSLKYASFLYFLRFGSCSSLNEEEEVAAYFMDSRSICSCCK